MGEYRINLFEIKNPSDLMFEYRLVQVAGLEREAVSDPDLVDRNLNLLTKLVAIKEKCPVALLPRSGGHFLAIPGSTELSQAEYQLTPDVVALAPREDVHVLSLLPDYPEGRHIASKFLEFHLRGPLYAERRLWSSGALTYFGKTPINARSLDRDVDIFEGFHFHLRYLERRLLVSVKLMYRYVDSAWAADRFSQDDLKRLRMRYFLYYGANNSFPVQLLELLPKSIKDAKFAVEGSESPTNVFDYTMQLAGENPAPWIRSLDPNSAAIVFRVAGRDQRLFGALALAKLIHRTNDPGVRDLHRASIKRPDDRFRFSKQVITKHFSGRRFFGQAIEISPDPLDVRPTQYRIPALEFGQQRQLRIGSQLDRDETPLAELGKARMDLLLDPGAGIAVRSALDAQYMLVPLSLERTIAAEVSSRLEATTRTFLQSSFRFDRVHFEDRQARTLKQQVEAVVSALDQAKTTHGRGVLILPKRAHPDLHNYVKRALRDRLHLQCLDANRIEEFFHSVLRKGQKSIEVRPEREGLFRSYLRHAALGLLIVNRQWGWVLYEGTHYDGYISVDVLNHEAAFTFFFDGGRVCYTKLHETKQPERLLRAQVRTIVTEALKAEGARSANLRSIVFQRDGRLFESEWLGFQDAISSMIGRELRQDLVCGAVEVAKKTSSALRLVRERSDGLQNPQVGTSLALNDHEGIVCTTGYPFKLVGTVDPLTIRATRGPLKLDWVMEDVFRKSLLRLARSGPLHDFANRLEALRRVLAGFRRTSGRRRGHVWAG